MALKYELETDIRYQQGLKKGEKTGETHRTQLVVLNMLRSELFKNGLVSMVQIAQLAGTTQAFVRQMLQKLQEEESTD